MIDPRWAEEALDDDYGPLQEPTDNYYRIALPSLGDPGDDAWRKQSLCLVYPSIDFFNYRHKKDALAVCAECTVREECLDFALRNREESGVWGGVDEEGRRAILRSR